MSMNCALSVVRSEFLSDSSLVNTHPAGLWSCVRVRVRVCACACARSLSLTVGT